MLLASFFTSHKSYSHSMNPACYFNFTPSIDNRRPEAPYGANTKLNMHPRFAPPIFQHCFLALPLVPVLENSSNNPSIMFSKLFRGEQNSPKAVLFIWRTSIWKVLAHVCWSSWSNMVNFSRRLSINNTMCTGMWFMVNWLWFTKSVIFTFIVSTLRTCQNTSLHS